MSVRTTRHITVEGIDAEMVLIPYTDEDGDRLWAFEMEDVDGTFLVLNTSDEDVQELVRAIEQVEW